MEGNTVSQNLSFLKEHTDKDIPSESMLMGYELPREWCFGLNLHSVLLEKQDYLQFLSAQGYLPTTF